MTPRGIWGWAEEEFQGIDLGDQLRNRHAIDQVERLAKRPTENLPVANRGGKTQAAYGDFGNDAIVAQEN